MPKLGAINPRWIGIVGSRRRTNYKDYDLVETKFFKVYRKGDFIVSGGCADGADAFAEQIAKDFKIPIMIYYPREEDLDKKLHKANPRAAYAKINYARNTLIAKHADILIACVAPDRKGGTEDTIKKFLARDDKVVRVIYA